MIRKTTAVLAILSVLAGCAEEGGSRGSGVSTAIEGNLVRIESASNSSAVLARVSSSVAGVEVAVEGSSAKGTTDAAGHFSLHGYFYGPIEVIFSRSSDGLLARLAVKIPAGGTLTLADVSVDASQQQAVAASQEIQCEAKITATSCSSETLTMASAFQGSGAESEDYVVHLDTSTVRDAAGHPVSCADLSVGQRAMVQASVEADGSFRNATIEIEGQS
ncbi:MAG TPA: hypothetical protein VMT89_03415 [Candidatus Acidoferrales bacterium]|nr:hypothetical protein [Candidatus Acidoferrales bacterium]